jgi:DNA-binding CsgD family transcriptional regulator
MPKYPKDEKIELKIKGIEDELDRRVKEQAKEMELKIKSLEELNKGMEALLKKKEKDKREIENNILANVKMLILPYFEKIKKTKLDDRQKVFIDIIESNINEIISPFPRKMSIKELNLTPMEIQIANLIIQGAPSKKIGKIMNISPRTVDTHRKNIRKKIGLDQKRANLRSYLLALN